MFCVPNVYVRIIISSTSGLNLNREVIKDRKMVFLLALGRFAFPFFFCPRLKVSLVNAIHYCLLHHVGAAIVLFQVEL